MNNRRSTTTKMSCCLIAAVAAMLSARAYTCRDYAQQDHLIAQWDGINNAGAETQHDPNATTWKDLIGDNDFTIDSSSDRHAEWRRGVAFYFDNIACGLAAAYSKRAVTTYKTIEIVCKGTSRSGRIMFWSGDRSRYVLFDHSGVSGLEAPYSIAYFDGSEWMKQKATSYARINFSVPNALVATYDDANHVTNVYVDAVQGRGGNTYNSWNAGDGGNMTLGARSKSSAVKNYGWAGEVYAIRLYDCVLTPEEIAHNHAVDVKRFFTSAMYDKTGMISFWDGKDNVGEGAHDSAAKSWVNLVSGGQSLTPNNASWSESGLVCDGTAKSGAYGTSTMTYGSLEVLFYHDAEPLNNNWLFSNGIDRYLTLGEQRTQWQNYAGIYSQNQDQIFSRRHGGRHLLSWVNKGSTDAYAYLDGAEVPYTPYQQQPSSQSPRLDNWGNGGAFVQVGGRGDGKVLSKGVVYAVRAYSSALSTDRVYENAKIDAERYANARRWNGGIGDFGTVANWLDVNTATAVPGVDDTVDLPYGSSTILLDQDRKVGAIRARNGNVAYAEGIDATLDLGGHKLTVVGAFEADATMGYNDRRFGCLTLTNGSFQAESVSIGALSERIPRWDGCIGYEWAFANGSGALNVDGANVVIRKRVSLEGPYAMLRVAGGASFTCDRLTAYATQSRQSAYPAGRYDRALLAFTGKGTTATLGSLSVHRDVDLRIEDGARVKVTGYDDVYEGLDSKISSIGHSYSQASGNSSRLVVDHATFETQSPAFAIGFAYRGRNGGGTTCTLQNGATLLATSATTSFYVGFASNNGNCDSEHCALNVLGGSLFAGTNTEVIVGRIGDTSYSGIAVSNATLVAKTVKLGWWNTASISSNTYLTVSGAAPRIDIRGTDDSSLQLRMGAQLRFVIPADGFATPPITTSGGVSVYEDEKDYAVAPVSLVVDASALDLRHFNGRQVLIQCAKDSTASLQRLIDNRVVEKKRHKGSLRIEDGGTKLVYYQPGLCIFVR